MITRELRERRNLALFQEIPRRVSRNEAGEMTDRHDLQMEQDESYGLGEEWKKSTEVSESLLSSDIVGDRH